MQARHSTGLLSSGCDGDPADLVPRDRLGNEPRRLDFIGESGEVARGGRPALGVPTDCWTTVKRPSRTRDPGRVSASVTSRGFSPESTSSLSLTKTSYEPWIALARTSVAFLMLRLRYRSYALFTAVAIRTPLRSTSSIERIFEPAGTR